MTLFLEFCLVLTFAFLLSVLASFFNVVIFRTFRGESFSKGRSKCEYCYQQISWYDNVPILSFLLLKGQCRHCHHKIAKIYFFTELIAFLFGIVSCVLYVVSPFLQHLPFWQLIIYLLIIFVLSFTVLSDLKYLLVPDLFVWLLVILVVILQLLSTAAWSLPILAVLFSTGFFLLLAFVAKKILRKDALGLGDVKLMIPLSFLLSWPKTVLSIFLAFIIGGIFAMLLLLTGKKKVGQAVPFAPFLIVAAVVSFVYGEAIWQWYLGFLL